MIKNIVKSSFLNQGQICLAGSRIYVQKKVGQNESQDSVNDLIKLEEEIGL